METKKSVMRFVIAALALVASLSCMAEIKKEYHVEKDGFEWYEILADVSDGYLVGVQDAKGNTIIPAKYNTISYRRELDDPEREGYFVVSTWSEYNPQDLSGKIDSYGQDIYYYGVYTKDGKCVIPTDMQCRLIYAGCVNYDSTPKRHFGFIRGDTFKEYGFCDEDGRVLFMKKSDECVKCAVMDENSYWILTYAPEYGKISYECSIIDKYYFDFEHNLIGRSSDHSVEDIQRIAKQRNLRHPLADAPVKAIP